MLIHQKVNFVVEIFLTLIKLCILLFSIAYGNLGSILSSQGRFAEAEEAFIQALRYRPNMADVHYNL